MGKFLRKFLIFTIVFSIFLFVVFETQLAFSTGIIDKDRCISFRFKNGSTGVISFFGHKTYVNTQKAAIARDILRGVVDFEKAFLPSFVSAGASMSASNYFSILKSMSSLFSENAFFSEPDNAEAF